MSASELREIMKDSKLDLLGLEESEQINGGGIEIIVSLPDLKDFMNQITIIGRTTGLIAPNYF